jgi:hypothetical protein
VFDPVFNRGTSPYPPVGSVMAEIGSKTVDAFFWFTNPQRPGRFRSAKASLRFRGLYSQQTRWMGRIGAGDRRGAMSRACLRPVVAGLAFSSPRAGTARTFVRWPTTSTSARASAQNLDEEKAADRKLTEIAEARLNLQAASWRDRQVTDLSAAATRG